MFCETIFFNELSYNEIAEKHKISVGSVGVYLQRGLASLRSVIARKPDLKSEFVAMLSDARVVRVLLPLVSALQLGEWFRDNMIMFSKERIEEDELSDEDRLRIADETLPDEQSITKSQRALLLASLNRK